MAAGGGWAARYGHGALILVAVFAQEEGREVAGGSSRGWRSQGVGWEDSEREESPQICAQVLTELFHFRK